MSWKKEAYPGVVGPIGDESGAMGDTEGVAEKPGAGGTEPTQLDRTEQGEYGTSTPLYSIQPGNATQPDGEMSTREPYNDGATLSPVDENNYEDPAYVSVADDEALEDEEMEDANDVDLTVFDADSPEEAIAEFKCDVAEKYQDKIAGLQVYNSLKESQGLLFKYSRPQDVMYHMGTVRFPIDIIFIDENDRIKKLYRNIQPGSLATYGCASVKHVLEIPGGLSDRLGLYKNCYVKISKKKERNSYLDQYVKKLGYKKAFIKHSSFGGNSVSNWKDYSIFSFNDSLTKTAAVLKTTTSLLSQMPTLTKKVAGFYIDKLIKDEDFNSDDFKDMAAEMSRIAENDKFIPVLLTSGNKNFSNKVSKILDLENGTYQSLRKFNSIAIEPGSDYIDLSKAIERKYPGADFRIYADDSILKNAGVPVPGSTKEIAKEILQLLDRVEDKAEKSKINLEKNLTEYQKFLNDPAEVIKTQGQYNESIKSNVKVIKSYLVSMRDAISKLNQIKDISTTLDVIDSLADAAKESARSAEEVFELVEQMDSEDFMLSLEEKTTFYSTRIEDMMGSIDRAREYVNNEILGVIVLSR